MDNETHLANLRMIISEKGKNIESISSDIQSNFYHEIADDEFRMPPLYSNGNKIKYMLLNYPNLKSDVKSKLGDKIILKWEAFNGTPKDAPPMEVSEPKIPKKTLFEESKEKEPTPEQEIIQTPPIETAEIKNVEKEMASKASIIPSLPEKSHEIEKPVIDKTTPELTAPVKVSLKATTVKKTAVKKTAVKKAAPIKAMPKKTATRKSAVKKVAPKKKPAAFSATRPSGPKKIRQTKKKTLKNDLDDLSRSMKSLEGKIEKMMKAFDGIAVQETTCTKAVKKKVSKKTINRTNAKLIDTDKVIKIITRRKKSGIDVPTLSERTGFDSQKIRNIVYRALKNGLIKRIATGLYVGSV